MPLASGENHFTRFEFNRVIEDGAITILQPDLSKTGGITEMLRIAAMASAYKLPINPHTCMTGLNMAATIHVLAAIDNGGYFEGDVSKNNLFRDELTSLALHGRQGRQCAAARSARHRRRGERGFPRRASADRGAGIRLELMKTTGEATMRAIRVLGIAVLPRSRWRSPARADFPDKTIRIVVPYPPGGFNDTLGRIVAQKFTDGWGVPAVVENRPGGGTLIGTDAVAKAPADGYTLLVVAFPFAVNPSLYAKLPYDTVKDFAPLILAGQTPNLLVVNNDVPIKSVKELIDTAKAEARLAQLRLHRQRLLEPPLDGAVPPDDRRPR